MLMHFRNDEVFAKVNVSLNLSSGERKIDGRKQLRSHSLFE